jgi:chromosomal replication initiation ATPase DnaA
VTLSATDAWTRLLDRAKIELPEHVIETWLTPLAPDTFDGTALTLTAPDQWSVEWNESKHLALLEGFAPTCIGHPIKVIFKVQAERLKRSQMDLFVPQNSAIIALFSAL